MTQVEDNVADMAAQAAASENEMIAPLNPAQQSLSDALRVSFLVLKVAMVIAVIAYLLSGIFEVNEQQRALLLRFGRIVGKAGEQVYKPGWHFGWPYPIEKVVKVPTSPQSLMVNKPFWYGSEQHGSGELNPLKDGSLLTGDYDIVHARLTISYKVAKPVEFARNVTTMARADQIVRAAVEQAIVEAVAQVKADNAIRGAANQGLAKKYLQDDLDRMHTGLRVDTFSLDNGKCVMPQAVHAAYQAVSNAENQRSAEINQARQKRAQILGSAAGEAGLPAADGTPGPLVRLMNAYQSAFEAGDTHKAEALLTKLNTALRTLEIDNGKGQKMAIGGQAASIINQALSYGVQVQQQMLSERTNFNVLYKQYLKNPRILADRLWQDARDKIFTGNVETFYAMPGQQYIVTNRSPAMQRKLEQAAMQAAEKSAKNAGSSSSSNSSGGD